MSDEQEDQMLLEDWDEELFCELDPCISERDLRIIMICMECGNSLDCCICEVSVPTSTSSRASSTPSSESQFSDSACSCCCIQFAVAPPVSENMIFSKILTRPPVTEDAREVYSAS